VETGSGLSRTARSNILAHLRTLRANLAEARDVLMHFRADRPDRDRLEPAARRVDDLMNMFASEVRHPAQAAAWVSEIQGGVEQVTNEKVTAMLNAARTELGALREEMGEATK
jgi:hypothetical protein